VSHAARRRAIFLDRDGVINRAEIRDGKPYPPDSLAATEILPGVAEALKQLRAAAFLLIGVTNQPDVARGTQQKEVVEAINGALLSKLELDEIIVCFHDTADNCDCRKPKPGLITSAAAKYKIDVPRSFMVGDRWRDIEAGKAAGCKTIWLNQNYNEKVPTDPDYVARTLLETVPWILNQSNQA
jgi:D-glycero-D-manno-heptose 1,7-bisphosphate phosphatase